MTGKTNRKPAPYQLHQAYSIHHYQPDQSELREQVEDLWSKRKEQSTIDLLKPYGWNGSSEARIAFHGAVMQWKCSLLTDEERQELQEWIDKTALEKEEEAKQPWKVVQSGGEDGLSTQNKYIRRYVWSLSLLIMRMLTKTLSCIEALPETIEKALGEIERSTGMKSIILIGGPSPLVNGDFSTH